jgi:hypothetical protein
MKLEIGKRYTISDKIKNAFGVKSSEAKVVSISNSIVMLEIDGMAFPLKEAIALTNLYNSYQLTAQMTEEKEKKYEDSIPETVEDDVPVVTPEPEEIEGDDISTPVVESDPKESIDEGVDDTEPEENNQPPEETPEETNDPAEEGVENPVEDEVNVDNSIVITVPEVETEPENEIIEENPQDNPEPEEEYDPYAEYNPDDDWAF